MRISFIKKITLLLMASLSIGLATSCKKKTLPEDPVVKDVQIKRFALSSKKNPDLIKTFFSINHNSGKIYNVIPLDFGLELDSTALIIDKEKTAFAIEVSLEGGEYKLWKVTDSLYLKDIRNLSLRVRTQEKDLEKYYDVKINQHAWDPSTTDWQPLAGALVPASAASGFQEVLCYKDKAWLFCSDNGSTKLYQTDRNNPISWSQLVLNGLNGTVKQLTQNNEHVWAFCSDGKLYHSSNYTDWTTIRLDAELVSMLGSIYDKGVYKLALLLNAPRLGRIFATYADGQLKRFEKAPANFPLDKFASFNYLAFNKQGIRLLGGVKEGGKANKSLWASSNGEDWMEIDKESAGTIVSSTERGTLAQTPGDKRLYYYSWEPVLEIRGRALAVSYSLDEGRSWKKGKSMLMLPNPENFGKRTGLVTAFGSEKNNIYLFGGVNSEGIYPTDLWVGSLRLNERK